MESNVVLITVNRMVSDGAIPNKRHIVVFYSKCVVFHSVIRHDTNPNQITKKKGALNLDECNNSSPISKGVDVVVDCRFET